MPMMRLLKDMDKPDCYKCEYRMDVPGSTHSSCHHPMVKPILDDPIGQLLALFASISRLPTIIIPLESFGIKVRGTATGIKNGWFNYPYNFDPIWLEECDGFKPKIKVIAKWEK